MTAIAPSSATAPSPGADANGHLAVPGSLARTIGTGEHAQAAILYSVTRWTFLVAAASTAAVLGYDAWKGANNMVSDLKEVWAVFAPLITLALGYVFGRRQA